MKTKEDAVKKPIFEILEEKYPLILTYADLGKIFQLHVKTVKKYIGNGKLPFNNVGVGDPRFLLTDVADFLDKPRRKNSTKKLSAKATSQFSFKDGECDTLLNHCGM